MTDSAEDVGARLGSAIRARRHQRGMTLVEVAARTGLSHPFLSQLERGLARPSMRSLTVIASTLGTTAQALMSASELPAVPDGEPVSVVRRAVDDVALVDSPGGSVRPLVRGERAMLPVEFNGAPREFADYYRHDGEEFVYVVGGLIEIEVEGELHRAAAGDSVYYPGGYQHRWRSLSDEEVHLVVVQQNLPPNPHPELAGTKHRADAGVTCRPDDVDEVNITGRPPSLKGPSLKGPVTEGETVRVGVFMFGGVEMSDAGLAGTPPLDRRYGRDAIDHAHRELLACGELAERLGYDSFWLTEHHFQHEGYEVVPNGLLFSAFLAARTSRLRLGTMFNVVGQWHPLRLAEDFALLHNLSGGRGILGVGRGTVPREMLPLTAGRVSVGSYDNPSAAEADRVNREVTEESLDVLRAALDQETFSYSGKHFCLPPPGIPDRGGEVAELTLVPRPAHPYETWQAVTSPPTLRAVPTRGLGGVFWLKERNRLAADWRAFAATYQAVHGRPLRRGEKRMLVLNVGLGDTREQAVAQVRDGHDEFWRFLAPYGWGRGYARPDGRPADGDFVPTLADSMAQGPWAVGTAADVAAAIGVLDEDLGLTDLVIFPAMPGDPYPRAREQMTRFAEEVVPLLPADTEVTR